MKPNPITGPGAGVLKYDTLTALGMCGLHGSSTLQMSVLRVITVITARYDWRRDEIRIGQRELAQIWGVNERTVKREIKRLVSGGILTCKSPGVRGRVASYTLNQAGIRALSNAHWRVIGPDFEHRMATHQAKDDTKVVRVNFAGQGGEPPPERDETLTGWPAVQAELRREAPEIFDNWFARLEFLSVERGTVSIRSPSRFISRYVEANYASRLIAALEQEFGPISRLDISTMDSAGGANARPGPRR